MHIRLYINKSHHFHALQTAVFLFICLITSPMRATELPLIDFYLPIQAKNNSIIGQLSEALTAAGLENINIKRIAYWQEYQQAIRHGRPGFYLGPPHFSAWLLHEHNFIPVAKIKGSLSYVIVSQSNNTEIFEIRDLINQKICTQHPLNLDYLLISQAFANSIQSAESFIVDSVNNELHNTSSPCAAFSISEYWFSTLDKADPGKYIRLMQGPRYSNYAVLADPMINPDNSIQFKNFLNQQNVQAILKSLLEHTHSDTRFIKIRNDDFPAQHSQLLLKYWSR